MEENNEEIRHIENGASGKFGKDETMEEMIESCIPFWINNSDCKTAEDARNKMMEIFPNLKRWKN